MVTLAPSGVEALRRAGPLWEAAQCRVEDGLGVERAQRLRALALTSELLSTDSSDGHETETACMSTIFAGRGALAPNPAPFSLSNRLAATLRKRDVHYSWIAAGARFLVMLATAGAIGVPGVIIKPLETEFGWSAADISGCNVAGLSISPALGDAVAAWISEGQPPGDVSDRRHRQYAG
jgi:hypothetical protein